MKKFSRSLRPKKYSGPLPMTDKKPPPILVTGSHRSGTTWTGRMLGSAHDVGYIHEPFNKGTRIGVVPTAFDNWYHHVRPDEAHLKKAMLTRVFDFHYPAFENLIRIRRPDEAAKFVRDLGLFFWHRQKKSRPLVKDPLAFFSAEWLARTFSMDVVVLIRHPAAFCSSLKIKNWTFNPRYFAKQPLLIRTYLSPFEAQIHHYATAAPGAASRLDKTILLWNCIHHTIRTFRKTHPEWHFVRHEDLSRNPVAAFEALYRKLGLVFSPDVEKKIRKASGAQNPVEQKKSNEYIRNSRQNILNWKKRLTDKEIHHIRQQTAEIAAEFYTDADW